jgi:hypothetical protein
LIQSEHVRFEYISIQLDAGASSPQQSTKIKAFQKRLYQVYHRLKRKTDAIILSTFFALF